MTYISTFHPGGNLAAAGGEEEESKRGEGRRNGIWLGRTPLSCHTKHQEWSSGTGCRRTVLWDLRFFPLFITSRSIRECQALVRARLHGLISGVKIPISRDLVLQPRQGMGERMCAAYKSLPTEWQIDSRSPNRVPRNRRIMRLSFMRLESVVSAGTQYSVAGEITTTFTPRSRVTQKIRNAQHIMP